MIKKITSYLIAYTAKYLLKLISWTCKKEYFGLEDFLKTAKANPCIVMLWHNRLALVAEAFSTKANDFNYAAFISNSRDGEPLAILAKSYPNGNIIRVHHQSRHQALREMIHRLQDEREIILITPDGPRGPRYKIKPGIKLAAKQANAWIVPFSWDAKTFWELKTWDKFRIPKPFTTITYKWGTPISPEQIDEGLKTFENSITDFS